VSAPPIRSARTDWPYVRLAWESCGKAGLCVAAVGPRGGVYAGGMLWAKWKALSGSQAFLTRMRRAKLAP
jgi:hypothetical protein